MGVELSVAHQINDSWSISANGTVMKREFTNFCSEDDFLGFANEIGVYAGLEESISAGGNPCWVLDGLEVADQPSFNITLIPRYNTEFGNGFRFVASATLRYTDQYYDEFSNTREKPAIGRVNLNFSLAKGGFSGLLYINNLLDDEGMTPRNATSVARFDQLNAPADIPAEYQYDALGGPWGSFRMEPNFGRTFGVRLNYDFGRN
jgi:hypothetical protein